MPGVCGNLPISGNPYRFRRLTKKNSGPMIDKSPGDVRMKCSLRQLLSVISVLSFACATLGADGSGAPGAVLQASGKVQVNGIGSRKTTTLFSGDSVQTDAHSVASIIASGSSVFVSPNASVKFLGNAVEVEEGDVTITTSAGMAAKADA